MRTICSKINTRKQVVGRLRKWELLPAHNSVQQDHYSAYLTYLFKALAYITTDLRRYYRIQWRLFL